MRSTLLPGQQWDVMVDLFFYREPEETKEPGEEDAADYGVDQYAPGQGLPAPGGELCPHQFSMFWYAIWRFYHRYHHDYETDQYAPGRGLLAPGDEHCVVSLV